MSLRIARIGAMTGALALAGLAAAASAQQQPQPARGALREACAADYRTLCSGVQPGGGRIMACFREHAAQLSTGCKQALEAAKAARQKSGS